MRIDLDEKQRRIIESWETRAAIPDSDPYYSFISLWIAFNARLYAEYARVANGRRADLHKDDGLNSVSSLPQKAEGVAQFADGRYKIDLDRPGQISIRISERYTEDIIFARFAKDYRSLYETLLKEAEFCKAVKGFQSTIEENKRHFVMNMAKAQDFDVNVDFEVMTKKNIVVPFEDFGSLKELKNVLYQVRNNVFHGEKTPGTLNDDRIVRAAIPVLRRIVRALMEPSNKDSGDSIPHSETHRDEGSIK